MLPTVSEDPTSEEILSFVRKGQNILITGPGGTGKSTIVRRIAEEVINVSVTAMTGCAALLLDCRAKTLHSWAGIGIGKDPFEKLLDTIMKKRHVKKRWTSTKTLVIDEVSMLTPELFELLDRLGRSIRKSPTKLFGGIQLVLVGDFCQLPPVATDMRFLFESELWSGITNYIVLNKIWRQSDPIYQKILSEVRFGKLTSESEMILRSRMNRDWQNEVVRPTLLFSRNYEVDKVNETNLSAISSPVHVFKSQKVIDCSRWEELGLMPGLDSEPVVWALGKLEQDASFVNSLELRDGAQVMLMSNCDIEAGLVNGSRGVIAGFTKTGFPIVQFKKGGKHIIEPFTWWSHEMPHVGVKQIPLRVAYAITIHKSQGASIDSAIVDIGKNTFEYGQAYVALSRVRSLEGLYIFAFDVGRIMTHPRVIEFYKGISSVG